jgi:hypothetical protein
VSASLNRVVHDAIQKYLDDNGYHTMTMSPNLLNDTTQRELAQAITKAISAYMGQIKHRTV